MSEQSTVIVPSTPADLDDIKRVIKGVSGMWIAAEKQKQTARDELKAVAEKYEIPQKFINKLAASYHKSAYTKQTQEFEDFQELYDAVFKGDAGAV